MDETPSQPVEPLNPDPLVKAVRGLSRAVWCMAIGILLLFGFFITMTLWPMIYSRHTVGPVTQRSEPPTWQPEKFEGKDFNELPIEKKIKYASVILITKHVKTRRRHERSDCRDHEGEARDGLPPEGRRRIQVARDVSRARSECRRRAKSSSWSGLRPISASRIPTRADQFGSGRVPGCRSNGLREEREGAEGK